MKTTVSMCVGVVCVAATLCSSAMAADTAAASGAPVPAGATTLPPPPPPPTPGLWQTTISSPMQPQANQTFSSCLKPGQPPDYLVPPVQDEKLTCKRSAGHKESTNVVTWTYTCSNEKLSTTQSGSLAYQPESYEGSVRTTVSTPQMVKAGMKAFTTTLSMRGKRVGDCK